ncbi:unnamed protein product [Clonostachys byssicola]|uniref:Amidohydrolase-related domain-containing protein n=1 Tax=Clonostachys byssicola TaxID=160290 RepID=A0A9N9UF07_9HYPO|nr:unnamed protein product [Clonostachys byssicola]
MLSFAIFVLHFLLASVHYAYAHYEDGGPFAFDRKSADYNNQFISHQAPILVLENVRVVDGMGNAPEEAQTIVIEDGKINALGATGSIPIPKDAKVISGAGKTVLPGYVMHHEHLYYHSLSQVPGMPYLATPSMVTVPRLYLSVGVTTARSIGTYHPFDDLKLKEGISKDILIGPDLFLTAPFIQGDPGYYQLMPEINSAEAAKREVGYWAERGFHNFKTYVDISRSEMRAAAEEAHAHGKNISAHLCSVSILEALDAGIDEVEHGFQSIAADILRLHEGEEVGFQSNSTMDRDAKLGEQFVMTAGMDFNQDRRQCRFDILFGPLMMDLDVDSTEVNYIFQRVIEKGAVVDSTLGGLARLLPNSILPPVNDEAKSFYTPQRLAQWEHEIKKIHSKAGDVTIFLQKLMELDYKFWKAGGNLVMGSDAVSLAGAVPGSTNLESLELLFMAGIPPLEVIKIATLNGARALDLFDRGTVAEGQRADLILLNGNPVEDFKAIYDIDTVFKKGVGYSSARLQDSVRETIGIIN